MLLINEYLAITTTNKLDIINRLTESKSICGSLRKPYNKYLL